MEPAIITKAWIRDTPHDTGLTTYDVLVNVKGYEGAFLHSIHFDKRDATGLIHLLVGYRVIDMLYLTRSN